MSAFGQKRTLDFQYILLAVIPKSSTLSSAPVRDMRETFKRLSFFDTHVHEGLSIELHMRMVLEQHVVGLTHRALELLTREIGSVNATKFVNTVTYDNSYMLQSHPV